MKKILNLILSLTLCASGMELGTLTVNANEEIDHYVEVNQGDKETQKQNEEILLQNLEAAENLNNMIKPKGWGDTIRPAITPVKQLNDYYCAPASVFMVLTNINGSSVSQSTLASSMGTTLSEGTYVYKVTNELNKRQSKFKYAHQLISSKDALKKALYTSIGYNAPVILNVNTKSLTMYNGYATDHYVVAQNVIEDNNVGRLDRIGYLDPWSYNCGNGNV